MNKIEIYCIPENITRILCGCIDFTLVFILATILYPDITTISIYLYFCLTPMVFKGQTLGQIIFGLKTVSLTQKELSLIQIFSRQMLILPISFISFAIGDKVFLNNLKQTPQDRLMQTIVINRRTIHQFDKNITYENKNKKQYIGFVISIILFMYIISLNIKIY